MSAGALLLGALTCYRLTTFITSDTITRSWRAAVADRWKPTGDGPHWIVELVNCGRCAGWWLAGPVAGGLVTLGEVHGPAHFAVAWVAIAGAVTLLVSVAP